MTSSPVVHEYGPGSLIRLADRGRSAGARRVLLVTGRRSFDASGASAIVDPLDGFAHVTRWSEFSPNPDVVDLRSGLEVLARADPDLVIGIGGGSVMDMAKLLVAFDGRPPAGLESDIRGAGSVGTRHRDLFLAPTTSGSGSETTHFAVVYIGDAKFSIAGEGLRASAIALDPELPRTGSAHQRATSGTDAICQATESMWAVGATDRSRRFARHALQLLIPAIRPFVQDADDRSARAMAIGSHLAGRAIDISKTTAAHALSYGITKRYGVDHGNAVAITLGHFIQDHATDLDRLQPGRSTEQHQAAMTTIADAYGVDEPIAAGPALMRLIGEIGLVTSLTEAGLQDTAELQELAESVNVERLGNNPVSYTTEQLVDVLERSLA